MKITDTMRKYYDRKIKCPVCNRKVAETFLNPPKENPNKEYRDLINTVVCNECGWRGKVDQLKG